MKFKRSRLVVVGAISATLLATLVALNLSSGETAVAHQIEHRYSVHDPQFLRVMGTLLGPPLVDGNQATLLVNGDQIFPAMLAEIRKAQRTITFETYIYWSGKIGKEFAEALMERARGGVKVHVLLDWVGTGRMDNAILDEMRAAGVEVEKYRPLRWYHLARFNNRTHRKLLVIDGRVGFTGGVGIADLWTGNAQDPDHWRDSHFRLEGPAVAHLQNAFMDNWMKTHARVLHGEEYFPPLSAAGGQQAQVFKSSAREGSGSVRLMYLLSIAAAKRSIRIANAYFVPDDLSVDMLVAARKRGVTIELLVPGHHTDSQVVRHASRSRWGELIEAGVEIYEFQPTMMHCKVLVVDDVWTSVGSTNFDNRSFRLNDEANLNVFDAGFAAQNVAQIERDKGRSKRVSIEAWRTRPRRERVTEWAAGLLRVQL